jgi:hypothetical protein
LGIIHILRSSLPGTAIAYAGAYAVLKLKITCRGLSLFKIRIPSTNEGIKAIWAKNARFSATYYLPNDPPLNPALTGRGRLTRWKAFDLHLLELLPTSEILASKQSKQKQGF